MPIDHEFQLGQAVLCTFNGDIEGVPVSVTKAVFILSVYLSAKQDSSLKVLYTVGEFLPEPYRNPKQWSGVEQSRIQDLEPVVAAVAVAQATA